VRAWISARVRVAGRARGFPVNSGVAPPFGIIRNALDVSPTLAHDPAAIVDRLAFHVMPRAARRRGELVQRHGLPALDDESVDSLAAAKHLVRIVDRHRATVAEGTRDRVHHAVIDERFGPMAETGHAGDLAAIVEAVRVDDRRGPEVAKRSVLVHEELAARVNRDLSRCG
jgi:hypothetical protein